MYEKVKSSGKPKVKLTFELLNHLIRDRKLTDNEIAQETGYSHDHIYSSRRKWKIPRVKQWEKNIGDIKLTQLQQNCIEGTLLGDATINVSSSGLCSYGCGHSTGQVEYLRYLGTILNPFLSEKARQNLDKVRVEKVSDTCYTEAGFKTLGHPIFNHYRQLYYPEREVNGEIITDKVFPENLLERFNPTHLAFWYLDDGELDRNSFVIATSLIMSEEIKTKIVKILWESFNLNTCFGKVSTLPSGRLFCKLRILADSSIKFFEHLQPHLSKDLMHKIPENFVVGTRSKKIDLPKIVTIKRRFAEGKIFETRICQHPDCKSEFEINNANHSIYCTRECARTGNDAQKKERNKAKRNKTCKQCKQAFHDDSYAGSRRYCIICRPVEV